MDINKEKEIEELHSTLEEYCKNNDVFVNGVWLANKMKICYDGYNIIIDLQTCCLELIIHIRLRIYL